MHGPSEDLRQFVAAEASAFAVATEDALQTKRLKISRLSFQRFALPSLTRTEYELARLPLPLLTRSRRASCKNRRTITRHKHKHKHKHKHQRLRCLERIPRRSAPRSPVPSVSESRSTPGDFASQATWVQWRTLSSRSTRNSSSSG